MKIFYNIFNTSLERALDTYEFSVGEPPAWMNKDQQEAAKVDRWYVDMETAKCKPFEYLGSLGNFNNFASKAICENHRKPSIFFFCIYYC